MLSHQPQPPLRGILHKSLRKPCRSRANKSQQPGRLWKRLNLLHSSVTLYLPKDYYYFSLEFSPFAHQKTILSTKACLASQVLVRHFSTKKKILFSFFTCKMGIYAAVRICFPGSCLFSFYFPPVRLRSVR